MASMINVKVRYSKTLFEKVSVEDFCDIWMSPCRKRFQDKFLQMFTHYPNNGPSYHMQQSNQNVKKMANIDLLEAVSNYEIK